MGRTFHRAKYILLDADCILQNGAVCAAEDGRILSADSWDNARIQAEDRILDWGSALILPGFVNCHTHLELTDLHDQVAKSPSFTGWLADLVARRRPWTPQQYRDSARAGAHMALASGTVLVGDISASGSSWQALKETRIRKVVFEECTALAPEKAEEVAASLAKRLADVARDDLLSSGVSPHAPYSVSPQLFLAMSRLAHSRGLPLATHVAESQAELTFIKKGTGEFREFLAGLGALPAGWMPPGSSPVAYLYSLGVLKRPVLLIHCNYLDDESTTLILNSRSSVVFCPRSHAFFGHDPHPVRRLLDTGINVGLGTDSLASNDSLSMLDEMRFLFRHRQDLRSEEILTMATRRGAEALNLGSRLGRLDAGYLADMAVLTVPGDLGSRNLLDHILEGAGECVATILGGEVAWKREMTED